MSVFTWPSFLLFSFVCLVFFVVVFGFGRASRLVGT